LYHTALLRSFARVSILTATAFFKW